MTTGLIYQTMAVMMTGAGELPGKADPGVVVEVAGDTGGGLMGAGDLGEAVAVEVVVAAAVVLVGVAEA
jgi:hypothetical protein